MTAPRRNASVAGDEDNARNRVRARPVGGTSLRDQAYEEIKRRIITLTFRPGEYLNEASIAELLNVGRTPVHQAIDRLRLESMVEVIPRKGVIVKPISLNEVSEMTEVRMVNEPYSTGLAATRISEAALQRLDEICTLSDALAKARDLEGLMEQDRTFHAEIAKAAGNAILADILLRIHERSLRFWFISLSDSYHLREVQDQHRQIVEALRARDPEQASARMRDHIESFRKHILEAL